MSFGGNFLEYQAYPRTVGTDEFAYSVVDTRGGVATGTVRIVVVPPEEPQSPLAVDDQLTVEPGRTATFDPLANDYVAPGDDVRIELVDPPGGRRARPRDQPGHASRRRTGWTPPPSRSSTRSPTASTARVR